MSRHSERTGTAKHTCGDLQGNWPFQSCLFGCVYVSELNTHWIGGRRFFKRVNWGQLEYRAGSSVKKKKEKRSSHKNEQKYILTYNLIKPGDQNVWFLSLRVTTLNVIRVLNWSWTGSEAGANYLSTICGFLLWEGLGNNLPDTERWRMKWGNPK